VSTLKNIAKGQLRKSKYAVCPIWMTFSKSSEIGIFVIAQYFLKYEKYGSLKVALFFSPKKAVFEYKNVWP